MAASSRTSAAVVTGEEQHTPGTVAVDGNGRQFARTFDVGRDRVTPAGGPRLYNASSAQIAMAGRWPTGPTGPTGVTLRPGETSAPWSAGVGWLLAHGWNRLSRAGAMLDDLSTQGLRIPERQGVLGYLEDHPALVDALGPLVADAHSKLPSDVQLSLELYRDRESEDRYLTLYVRQAQYSPDLLERIEAASADWDGVLRGRGGWVLLNTDYQAPR